MYETNKYEGMIAETVGIKGYNGDTVYAYFARPLGEGPFPGIVIVPHLPGWDEFYKETTRRFAHHGYLAICPNINQRFGHGTPEDVAAKARAEGGVSDDSVVGDSEASMEYLRSLPNLNGKVGVFGTCSGGRHAFLVACRSNGFDAAIECWGGRVVMSKDELSAGQPVAPIDYTADLSCALLGIFGEDDSSPPPAQVDQHESELKNHNKDYEFHRYPGAGHGFFYYDRPAYRQEQAMDGWGKIWDFLGRKIG
ncbi:MAG: carboxymethylenebutenolidase [Chloroflexi bacterium]|jgi:carboxymethylenebutenolidase|nr:MAG: carboxymethylenebutenolidase [Chloroflexota bacterium]